MESLTLGFFRLGSGSWPQRAVQHGDEWTMLVGKWTGPIRTLTML